MTPKKEIEALELYELGWSIEDIRKQVRSSNRTIRGLIEEACEPDANRPPELDHSTDLLDYMQSGIDD